MQRITIILIALGLILGGAMPTSAMLADGHGQMVSNPGIEATIHQHGGAVDRGGDCEALCLDCGCVVHVASSIGERAFRGTIIRFANYHSPQPRDQAPRSHGDVDNPPPKS